MAKFLIGLATGIALVFLTVILLFFALLRFREKPPVIADNSVLVLRLAGEIPEKAPLELPSFLGGDHGAEFGSQARCDGLRVSLRLLGRQTQRLLARGFFILKSET